MTTLSQDIKHGIRVLVKSPGFTVVAVLALAFGIGTNTAIFSVVNSVLLKPLPYPNAERLVHFEGINSSKGISDSELSMPDFLDWQKETDAFESMTAFFQSGMVLMSNDAEPERVPRAVVTASFFPTMGVSPVLGRALVKADEDFEIPRRSWS